MDSLLGPAAVPWTDILWRIGAASLFGFIVGSTARYAVSRQAFARTCWWR